MHRHRFMCTIIAFIQAHGVFGGGPVGKMGNRRRRLRAVRGRAMEGGTGRYKGERVDRNIDVGCMMITKTLCLCQNTL